MSKASVLERPKVQTRRCLGAMVLVRRLDIEDELTKGGIVKPEIARMRSQRGEVVLAGPGEFVSGTFVPVDVEVGDTVLFTRYGGTDVEIEGEKLTLVHYRQLYLANV